MKVFGALVPSLAAIALSKGADKDTVLMDSCYGSLELILPFSESLPKKLLAESKGMRREASREIVELIKKDMPPAELLEEGIRKAGLGLLEDKDTKQFERPRVSCFSRFLGQLNGRTLRENAEAKTAAVK